jgi:AcrR family transcriptional regulator
MAPKLKPETLEKRKAQILQAALTSFASKGYHQTTMDDIVQEAGLSKGGLYWHFKSKKELFLELFQSLISDTEAILLAGMSSAANATQKLDAALEMLTALSTADEFKDIIPLMIDVWAQNIQDPDVNEIALGVYNQFRRPVVQVIEQGISSGEFKPVNASAYASILLAIYDGLMVQWIIDPSLVNWEAVNATVKNTLVAGLLTDQAK